MAKNIPYSIRHEEPEVIATAMLFSKSDYVFHIEVGMFDNEEATHFALCEIIDEAGFDSGNLVKVENARAIAPLDVDTPVLELHRVEQPVDPWEVVD